jgi:hypothetical protein
MSIRVVKNRRSPVSQFGSNDGNLASFINPVDGNNPPTTNIDRSAANTRGNDLVVPKRFLHYETHEY